MLIIKRIFCRQRGQSLGLSLAKMKTLLHVCCILELCSMVVVQNIPTFKGRGIRTTNSTRSQQIDIQNMIEAKKRKDYIKRQILHILNFSSISNHPPEQPSSVRPPQKAKKYTPDHSILSEPAGKFHLAKCLFFLRFSSLHHHTRESNFISPLPIKNVMKWSSTNILVTKDVVDSTVYHLHF